MIKSRPLNNEDFLDALQKEYFCAFLRSRIYPSIREKNYQKKLMGYKEEKIRDLSKKKVLLCIFNSPEEYDRVKELVIPSIGFPNIKYKDEKERFDLELSDKTNYYSEGSYILFKVEDEVQRGVIISFDLINEVISIRTKTKEYQNLSIKTVTRIL